MVVDLLNFQSLDSAHKKIRMLVYIVPQFLNTLGTQLLEKDSKFLRIDLSERYRHVLKQIPVTTLALLQRIFRFDLIINIGRQAIPLHNSSVVIPQWVSLTGNPTIDAISSANAISH